MSVEHGPTVPEQPYEGPTVQEIAGTLQEALGPKMTAKIAKGPGYEYGICHETWIQQLAAGERQDVQPHEMTRLLTAFVIVKVREGSQGERYWEDTEQANALRNFFREPDPKVGTPRAYALAENPVDVMQAAIAPQTFPS